MGSSQNMETYDNYECPKCQIKHIPVNEHFDGICKACGGRMKYINRTRKDDYKKADENFYKKLYEKTLKEKEELQFNTLRCPKCGSTAITTGSRGINWFWGTIGSGKTVNRCGKCGYTWKPNGR